MAINITTTSSTGYMSDKTNAIYPAFVDNMPYEAWGPGATIATSRTQYYQLKATGATAYLWSLESGALPPGMELSSDGKISTPNNGSVKKEGSYTFTVRATNADNNTDFATKTLTLVAEPFRAKWFQDAKFGIVIHWGRFSEIKLTDPATSTSQFEGRAVDFNPTAWAAQFVTWGVKVVHFTGIWQDSYRNWPSTTPTRLELKSIRNFVGELKTALDAVGIKLISYFPPDYQSNPLNITDGSLATNAWGSMNTGLLTELITVLKIDGVWFDVGGAPELYNYVDANWLYWDTVLPIMRRENPYFIFGINPGLRVGGVALRYPYSDFLIYESVPGTASDESLEIAIPSDTVRKKMAIDSSNTLSISWAFGTNGGSNPTKTAKGIIEAIKKNWAVNATFMLDLPVQASGLLLHPNFASVMNEVGAFVAANQGYSTTPFIENVSGKITMTYATPRTRIYYTTDNTTPIENVSNVYTGPFDAIPGTVIKAAAKEVDKPLGPIQKFVVETTTTNETTNKHRKLFKTTVGDSLITETSNYFKGMSFVIGQAPIILSKVGRKITSVEVDRDFIIREFHNNRVVYKGVLKTTDEEIDGYRYASVPDLKLQRGVNYYIAFKESSSAVYNSNSFGSIPSNQDIRITGPMSLSYLGDRATLNLTPISTGQYINLIYTVVDSERSSNKVLGKHVTFEGLGGAALGPSGGILYASNAIDGLEDSIARAGGEFPYRLVIDLLDIQEIERIAIHFTLANWATEFKVLAGPTRTSTTLLGNYFNNVLRDVTLKFNPIQARYIVIEATKPSASGQLGGQMVVKNVEVN